MDMLDLFPVGILVYFDPKELPGEWEKIMFETSDAGEISIWIRRA